MTENRTEIVEGSDGQPFIRVTENADPTPMPEPYEGGTVTENRVVLLIVVGLVGLIVLFLVLLNVVGAQEVHTSTTDPVPYVPEYAG